MNGESKLKVLRAAVALEKFTTREVMGWTGLTRSQVIPRISDLLNKKLIEYDSEYVEEAKALRPAHRPIRHYRLSPKGADRQKAFAEIRRMRSLTGVDPLAQSLAVLKGRFHELATIFDGVKNRRIVIERNLFTEYETRLLSLGSALDEALLELEPEDETSHNTISQLRALHEKLASELPEFAIVKLPEAVTESPAYAIARDRSLLRDFFHRYQEARNQEAHPLIEPEAVGGYLKPIAVQLWELNKALKFDAPEYSQEARFDYALSKVAAELIPEPSILLPMTQKLVHIAPEGDRHFYEYNCANLLAWIGKDEAAYKHWSRSVKDVGSRGQSQFRIIIGGLVDKQRIDETTWKEFEAQAHQAGGMVAVASRAPVPTLSCPYCLAGELSDPFSGTIKLANEDDAARYVVYGSSFRDLFQSQPGLSYSRLATTLYRVGIAPQEAWTVSRDVNEGKILVIFGDFRRWKSHPYDARIRSLLETKLGAQLIEIGSAHSTEGVIVK